MKRIGYLLLTAALASCGCIGPNFFRDEKKPPPAEVKAAPPAVVTPDSVTEENARERAGALRQEIEGDLAPREPAEAP